MNKFLGYLLATIFTSIIPAGNAQATLIDRGEGMIYDDVQKITWLKDANYAKTSGYDPDGFMTWQSADDWAGTLIYGGYSDWRLPTTSIYCIFKCTNSELGYMFYMYLGGGGDSIYLLNNNNFVLFDNIVPFHY